MRAERSFTPGRGCPTIFKDVTPFGDAGQVGAQTGDFGFRLGQRAKWKTDRMAA